MHATKVGDDESIVEINAWNNFCLLTSLSVRFASEIIHLEDDSIPKHISILLQDFRTIYGFDDNHLTVFELQTILKSISPDQWGVLLGPVMAKTLHLTKDENNFLGEGDAKKAADHYRIKIVMCHSEGLDALKTFDPKEERRKPRKKRRGHKRRDNKSQNQSKPSGVTYPECKLVCREGHFDVSLPVQSWVDYYNAKIEEGINFIASDREHTALNTTGDLTDEFISGNKVILEKDILEKLRLKYLACHVSSWDINRLSKNNPTKVSEKVMNLVGNDLYSQFNIYEVLKQLSKDPKNLSKQHDDAILVYQAFYRTLPLDDIRKEFNKLSYPSFKLRQTACNDLQLDYFKGSESLSFDDLIGKILLKRLICKLEEEIKSVPFHDQTVERLNITSMLNIYVAEVEDAMKRADVLSIEEIKALCSLVLTSDGKVTVTKLPTYDPTLFTPTPKCNRKPSSCPPKIKSTDLTRISRKVKETTFQWILRLIREIMNYVRSRVNRGVKKVASYIPVRSAVGPSAA